jgi:ParB-like chromosome segregation protein Spo0J
VKIETIGIEQLSVAAYNPRKDLQPSDREYQDLERSIARWDTVEPLVWNRRSGNLVSGHQRLKILKARGDTTVEVSVVDLSPEEEIALNIALNKTGGAWDDRKLFDALSTLDSSGLDLTLTGFDRDYLGDLAKGLDSDAKLFTPAVPVDEKIEAAPVTTEDVTAAAAKIDKKFEQKKTVEDVMCPHCGQTFGWQKVDKVAAPAEPAEVDA